VRTQPVTIRLDFYQCALIRRRAADIGLTKSAYTANLVLRGLENESTARLPAVLDLLDDKLQRLDKVLNERSNTSRQGNGDGDVVQLQHQAFMIEVLILLRYLVRDDLKIKGEIGRKIQKAVGDVRVEGT
jgi:hypothetical protein